MAPSPSTDTVSSPLEALIARAEAARAAGALGEGLAVTEPWESLAADAPLALHQRAAHLRLYFLYRAGALQELVDEGRRALPVLRREAAVDALFDALRWITVSACEVGQFGPALETAHECHQLALALDDRARQAMALNALAACFERMGDPWQGERLMGEALTLARDVQAPHEVFVTLNNLCAVLIGKFHLMRDATPAAEARLPLQAALPFAREAWALAEAQADPFPQVFVKGNLAEILTHLGFHDEAQQQLDAALALARQHDFMAQLWRMRCTEGELALALDDAQRAWTGLSEALEQSAGSGPRHTQMRLHHALAQAARRLGRAEDALRHLEHYLRLERERSLRQLHAQSQLFITRLEAEQVRLEAQRQRLRATALEADARRDQLTQVGNRREVERRLPGMLQRAAQSGLPLALAMVDIDHFKQVNDRHGHAAGDRVLTAIGEMLREATRAHDLVARLGGEEFLIALPDTDAPAAREVCERLRERIGSHGWGTIAPGLRVSVSIGLAGTPPYDERTLTARADGALYRAKADGRDRVATG